MNKFTYIKALWSPFKPFKLKWYVGKIAIGTPYFFPRKWVPNPEKPGSSKAVPKKIGFDFIGLGWKTKWEATDYRFEWSPVLSFVFFGYQIAVTVVAPYQDEYWESWLYYERNTDKTKSKQERTEQCIREFPQTYKQHSNEGTRIINYYDLILKDRYKQHG